MMAMPISIPIRGARGIKSKALPSLSQRRAPQPAWATPAPASPPIKACDELVGNPQYQVIRSNQAAEGYIHIGLVMRINDDDL